jgi:hypothetical protein
MFEMKIRLILQLVQESAAMKNLRSNRAPAETGSVINTPLQPDAKTEQNGIRFNASPAGRNC